MPSPILSVAALYVYPIKSARGIRLEDVKIGPRGFEHDRRWMVTDLQGQLVTQRTHPVLAQVDVALTDGGLTASAPNHPALQVPWQPQGSGREVAVWLDRMDARIVSAEANAWFSEVLGGTFALVNMPETTRRWQTGKPYRSLLSFADGNPFHLITETSLDDLQKHTARSLSPAVFRPNIVVTGTPLAYEEDFWRRIKIGNLHFAVVESCDRCAMINVTAEGKMTAEPLRTLTRLRRQGKQVPFGQHLIQDALEDQRSGTLQVGDPLIVIERGDTPNPMY